MISLFFPGLFLWPIVMFGPFGVFSCIRGLGMCFVACNAVNMGKWRCMVVIV